MPNWINGSLKLRGTYENVMRFFQEGINIYEHRMVSGTEKHDKNGETIAAKFEDVPVPKEKWLKIYDEHKKHDYAQIIFDGSDVQNRWAYVEGTRRAFLTTETNDIFITAEYERNSSKKTGNYIATAEVNQAWGFDSEDWLKIAQDYHVDIRLWGIESGMQFGQEIEIVNGGIILDSETGYDTWTIPLPWIGG